MRKRPPKNGIESFNTLLVDGNSLFKVGYHGAKDEYNADGLHIGGLYQFLTILRKLLSETLYSKVFVFWDGKFSGKLRYEIYKPYKSGRGKDYINGTQPVDPNELLQRKMVMQYLEELFIKQLEHEVIEGDDLIAYYCLTKSDNENVTICSGDRDMCQLIDDSVRIYFCDKKIYVDTLNYSSYFCHHKDNSVLIKIISGDNSDTIKGIKGVKEKTLLTLFPEINERPITLGELLTQAKILQEERGKKPLKALDNLLNSVTEGVQGINLYEINEKLVNLKKPMLTEEGIKELEDLIDAQLSTHDRSMKNVLILMKRDGIDKIIGEIRYSEYLIPFKQLIERELKQIKKQKNEQED